MRVRRRNLVKATLFPRKREVLLESVTCFVLFIFSIRYWSWRDLYLQILASCARLWILLLFTLGEAQAARFLLGTMDLHTSTTWPMVTSLLIYLVYSTKGDIKLVLKLPRLAKMQTHMWAGIDS